MFLFVLIIKTKLDVINLNNRVERLERKENNDIILFLGDSITERFKLEKYLPNYYTINSGVGGNTTTDIINDMQNRIHKYDYNKVFLLVGINDLLFTTESNEEIKQNIELIIDNLNKKESKIYLESVYPINTNITKDIPKESNERISQFNSTLKDICNNDKCIYINMHDDLIDKTGNLKKIYTNDGIHLNKIGYIKITKKLLKYIKE